MSDILPVSGMTRYLLDLIYRSLFGGESLTIPTTYYFSLWCATLDIDSTNDSVGEVTADSYQRVAVVNNDINFSEVIGAEIRNLTDIMFPIALEDWGIVTYVAIMDSETDGNMLYFSELSIEKEVISGDQFKFPPASIRIVIPIE